MTGADAVRAVGRVTIQPAVQLVARLEVYGRIGSPDRRLVVAANHFSWIDPPSLGAACPRTLYFMAKVEAHRVPGLGQLPRTFGAPCVAASPTGTPSARCARSSGDGARSGCSRRGRARRAVCPGPFSPGRRWSR